MVDGPVLLVTDYLLTVKIDSLGRYKTDKWG